MLTCLLHVQLFAQTVIPLYQRAAPNLKKGISTTPELVVRGPDGGARVSHVLTPTLTAYFPAHPNGRAVIICPGGGYRRLSIVKEGNDVAKQLSVSGTTAFVLKYRLPDSSLFDHSAVVPLQDLQAALQLVRTKAAHWQIQPHRIGVMGFSAGGHLAAMAGVHADTTFVDPVAGISVRPDFMILVYAAISMTDSLATSKSQLEARERLLGKTPPAAAIRFYSPELWVNATTPPAFLLHAADDDVVPLVNTTRFYERLQQQGITTSMHIYKKGGHGFGLYNKAEPGNWFQWLQEWLKNY